MTTVPVTNLFNKTPYLRTSRDFPSDPEQMSVEVNKSYLDIASSVNLRIIGLFPINKASITGENWFISPGNARQQTLRQAFTFTTTGSITHNISVTSPAQFTRCWGSYTNGTNSFGLIWGTSGGTIPNNISFYITATQIIFEVDGGAPALSSGLIVLEWLSNP